MTVPNYGSGWHIPQLSSDGGVAGGGGDGGGGYNPNDMGPFSWEMNGAENPSNLFGMSDNPFSSMDYGSMFDDGSSSLSNYDGISPIGNSGFDFNNPSFDNYYGSIGDFSNVGDTSALTEPYSSTTGQFGGYQGNDFLKSWKNAVSPFKGLVNNPVISTLMSLNPVTALLKVAMQGPQGLGSMFGSLLGGNSVPGALLGSLAGGQLANYATEGRFAPMNGGTVGGMLGAGLGAMSGNPYGATLGSFAGRELGNSSFGSGLSNLFSGGQGSQIANGANQQVTTNMLSTGLNDTGLGALVGLGAGLSNKNSLSGQINNLQGLYGQNSSYAQALRQQLERRDAAAGRRSQYGPREVELQAALAGNATKLAPSLQQLYSQKNMVNNLMLSSLLNNKQLLPQLQSAWNGLGSLFSSGGGTSPFVGGGFQSGTEGMGG